MAIDTRDKRAAVIGYVLGPRPYIVPDGAVIVEDRQSVLNLYLSTLSPVNWSLPTSILNVHLLPWRTTPYPDGAISAADRQALAGRYRAIAAASPMGSTPTARGISRALLRNIGRI